MKLLFRCPVCKNRHARGPVNGFNVYRCLYCGEAHRLLVHRPGERRVLTASIPRFLPTLQELAPLFLGDVFIHLDTQPFRPRQVRPPHELKLLGRSHRLSLEPCSAYTPLNAVVPKSGFSQEILTRMEESGYSGKLFDHLASAIQIFDTRRHYNNLSDLNIQLLDIVVLYLGSVPGSRIKASSAVAAPRSPCVEGLIGFCKEFDCNTIILGEEKEPETNVQKFNAQGIEVQWLDTATMPASCLSKLNLLDTMLRPTFESDAFSLWCAHRFTESHAWASTRQTTL